MYTRQNARLALIRNRSTPASQSPAPEAPKAEAFNISASECIRRLRAKGQPILLFGETEKERRLRLRALELLDERGAGGSTNEFKKALEEAQKAMDYREIDNRGKGKGKGREGDVEGEDGEEGEDLSRRRKREEPEILDLELAKTEPKKVYPLIYYALKVSPVSHRRLREIVRTAGTDDEPYRPERAGYKNGKTLWTTDQASHT